jgi:cyclopropane fatty-acyl-phospholipid synthase-like methyltransferase
MKDKDQLSPEVIYGLVADVGFRRHFHLGGFEATRELVELCHMDKDKYVLDVGCASGKTACCIAQRGVHRLALRQHKTERQKQ